MQHPEAEFIGSNQKQGGEPRRPDLPARGLIHSWEGDDISKKRMKDHPWPYHLVVNIPRRKIYQLVRLDRTAYALKGYSSMAPKYRQAHPAFETNHAGRFCIQVCLMGFAKSMHKLSKEDLDWLAEKVFAPLNDLCGIKNSFDVPLGAGDGYVLATESYKGRKTPTEWYRFDGWATHQTAPGQDHWDPGRLNTKYIEQRIAALKGEAMMPAMMDWARHYNKLPFGKGYDPIVEFVQRGLRSLGHYQGPVDGAKTEEVDEAVKAFETAELGEGPKRNENFGSVSWPRFLERLAEPPPQHGLGGLTEEELEQHFAEIEHRFDPTEDEQAAVQLRAFASQAETRVSSKKAGLSLVQRLKRDIIG